MDELPDNMLGGDQECDIKKDVEPYRDSSFELYRSWLVAVVSSGNVLQKVLTRNYLNKLDPDQVIFLYTKYTTRMGRRMNSRSQMATSAYTGLVKRLLPVGDYTAPKSDLDNKPVLLDALCVLSGEIYHRFGLEIAL